MKVLGPLLFILLFSAFARADLAPTQTLEQFLQNDRSIINSQDEEKIKNAVTAAYPLNIVDSLNCAFETIPVSGRYQDDETRFEIQEELNQKNILYINYQEQGMKKTSTSNELKVTEIHNMKEWRTFIHHEFRRVRVRGYTYGGMCVSTDEVKVNLKGDKKQILKVLIKEGMKENQIFFQKEACLSKFGPVFSMPTSMIFDQTLLSSDYSYDLLNFSCTQNQIEKLDLLPLAKIDRVQTPEIASPPLLGTLMSGLPKTPKAKDSKHFYLKETLFDRLRKKIRPGKRRAYYGCSSLKCPKI